MQVCLQAPHLVHLITPKMWSSHSLYPKCLPLKELAWPPRQRILTAHFFCCPLKGGPFFIIFSKRLFRCVRTMHFGVPACHILQFTSWIWSWQKHRVRCTILKSFLSAWALIQTKLSSCASAVACARVKSVTQTIKQTNRLVKSDKNVRPQMLSNLKWK